MKHAVDAPSSYDTEFEPYVYTRSALATNRGRSPNRRERRAIERDVRAALRDSGCTCQPTLVSDPDGRGGSHRHALGCPLGDRLDELWLVGRRLRLDVHVAKCQR